MEEQTNTISAEEFAKLQAQVELLKEQNLEATSKAKELEEKYNESNQTLTQREQELQDTLAKAKEYESQSQLNSFRLKATESGLKKEQTDILADLIDLSKVGDDIDLTAFVLKQEEKQEEKPKQGFPEEGKREELSIEDQVAQLLGK